MPITVMTPAVRFYQRGVTQIIKIPTIAGTNPTLAEVNAGTIVSGDVNSAPGWSLSTASLPTPDFGDRFTPNLPGDVTAADSSLVGWADATGADLGALFALDEICNIMFAFKGSAAGSQCRLWKKARVGSIDRPPDISAASQVTVAFALGAKYIDLIYPTS